LGVAEAGAKSLGKTSAMLFFYNAAELCIVELILLFIIVGRIVMRRVKGFSPPSEL